MKYRAVGNRCAANISSLNLPISAKEALSILIEKGFAPVKADPASLARQCIGVSAYRRGAKPSEAPAAVDCSSFIKWIYGRCGIWLPRRSIQQREMGESVQPEDIAAGDVIFVSGMIDYYIDDPEDGVGHVGLATESGTVIHAAGKKEGVVETPLERFIGEGKFRGARRYADKSEDFHVFETPPDREVEISDDLRWIVLQSLPR